MTREPHKHLAAVLGDRSLEDWLERRGNEYEHSDNYGMAPPLLEAAVRLREAAAALSSLRAEVLEHAAQIAEATVSTHNPRWDKAGSERHMWRNTHWQEAQEAIAAAIRQSLSRAEGSEEST